MSSTGTIVELKRLLDGRLSASIADCALHGANETDDPQTQPDAVPYPGTTQGIAAIPRPCKAHARTLDTYGAASSLEAEHLSNLGGISLDLSRMTLRLQGTPEAITAATSRFTAVKAVINCVFLTIPSALPMARVELLDKVVVKGFKACAKAGLPEVPYLLPEFHGTAAGVVGQATGVADIAAGLEDEGRQTGNTSSAVRQAQPDAVRLELTSTMVSHVGDGNVYAGLGVDPDDDKEMDRAEEFTTAEHEPALAHLRAVKTGVDPNDIRNPGGMLRRENLKGGVHASP